MLLMSDSIFYHESRQLILQITQKNKWVNIQEVLPQIEKTSNRQLPRYCGESNDRFEALLKLVYRTLVESRGNIAC